jgi:hypothetical protein
MARFLFNNVSYFLRPSPQNIRRGVPDSPVFSTQQHLAKIRTSTTQVPIEEIFVRLLYNHAQDHIYIRSCGTASSPLALPLLRSAQYLTGAAFSLCVLGMWGVYNAPHNFGGAHCV